MEAKLKGRNLVITLALQKPKLSPSGKSFVVATSHGFRPTAVKLENQEVWIGVNAFVRLPSPQHLARTCRSQKRRVRSQPAQREEVNEHVDEYQASSRISKFVARHSVSPRF